MGVSKASKCAFTNVIWELIISGKYVLGNFSSTWNAMMSEISHTITQQFKKVRINGYSVFNYC